MRLAWEMTKSTGKPYSAGLLRVAHSLGNALRHHPGIDVSWVRWNPWRRDWIRMEPDSGRPLHPEPPLERDDWWITPEVFSGREKPGLARWMDKSPCRKAAIFHDLIPLKYPEITWPRSVRRHPSYLKLIAGMDRVFPVSEAVGDELTAYFKKESLTTPPLTPIRLGTLTREMGRIDQNPDPPPLNILCVGILEPRKNQSLLLESLERAWKRGLPMNATLCGRLNPTFGKPVLKRINALVKAGRPLYYRGNIQDSSLQDLYRMAHLTVIPSIAEGGGLPLLESLGYGTPVLASDLPSLKEYGRGGGCRFFPVNDSLKLLENLESHLQNPALLRQLREEIRQRALPHWENTAYQIFHALTGMG